MGSLLTDQSHTYIICLLPIQPPVIHEGNIPQRTLFWVGAFNKTLVIGLMTHPIELIFQNIN